MEQSLNFLALVSPLIPALMVISVLFTLFGAWWSFRRRSFALSFDLERAVNSLAKRALVESKSTRLEEALDQKKESFLNIPNISFHYANKDEIKSYYNDYFKEPTVDQILGELVSETGGQIKGRLPQLLEARMGAKNLSKWISTVKLPDVSVAEMFRRYQRETIKNNQVTLGLELVDIDLSDLATFDKLVSEFESKFDMKLDDSQVEQKRVVLRERATEQTMIRLENVTSWVLAEGKFKISEVGGDFYKCTYEHPVNEYLAKEVKRVTIAMFLRKDSLEPNIAGNYAQSIERSIPLKAYGKVWQPLDRKGDVWELQITPLAVYYMKRLKCLRIIF
ncbi:MAG: hypothetical protein HYU86_09715 [Chloroflexi bacterium]|nr:hypothetical protein [Chloroflexota bacterium]